jgi:uncharacterized protein involved in exopolysaccharide biosynthesis
VVALNPIQILRILWVRRIIIFAAMLSAVAGGVLVMLILPPRYMATSRVVLDLVKPDPISGAVLQKGFADAYVRTQLELIRDYQVTGRVVDDLGWADNPDMQAAYAARSPGDDRDFRRWAAQSISLNTSAGLLDGTNILEIHSVGSNAEAARAMADEVRKAYIDATLGDSRADALHSSQFYAAQAQKAKVSLEQLEVEKAKFEQATGVVLQDNKHDVDDDRLRALTSTHLHQIKMRNTPEVDKVSVAKLDAAIDVASRTLGPNNPQLEALRAQRVAIADENAMKTAPAANPITMQEQHLAAANQMIDAQRSKILSESNNLSRAEEIQAAIALRRDEYSKASTRSAQLLTNSGGTETGIAPLGAAQTPLKPKFPNKPFILGGTLVLGGAFGVLLALFLEFLGRRVRNASDLTAVISAPLLAVVPNTAARESIWKRLRPRLPRLRIGFLQRRRRVAEA